MPDPLLFNLSESTAQSALNKVKCKSKECQMLCGRLNLQRATCSGQRATCNMHFKSSSCPKLFSASHSKHVFVNRNFTRACTGCVCVSLCVCECVCLVKVCSTNNFVLARSILINKPTETLALKAYMGK